MEKTITIDGKQVKLKLMQHQPSDIRRNLDGIYLPICLN